MSGRIILGDAGWLAPRRLDWLRALGWMAALAAACILAFNLTDQLVLRATMMVSNQPFTTRDAAPVAAKLLSAAAGCLAMLALYMGAVRLVERRPASELALARSPAETALGALIGIGLIGVIVGVNWIAGWVSISPVSATRIAEALRQTLRAAIVEEVLLRLIILRLLWRAFGVWPALFLSAAIFGGLHLGNPDATWFAGLCLFAGEGVAIGAYMITGRIWTAIGFHAGWNFAQGWIFGAMVSGVDGFAGGPLQTRPVSGVDPMLSGGGFGPEGSMACLAVSLMASAVALMIAWRRTGFQAADMKDRAPSKRNHPVPGPS